MRNMNPTNLSKYKTKKKYEKIISDIDQIINIFSLTQRSLKFFRTYTVVQEVVALIESNKVYLEMTKSKYLDLIKEE